MSTSTASGVPVAHARKAPVHRFDDGVRYGADVAHRHGCPTRAQHGSRPIGRGRPLSDDRLAALLSTDPHPPVAREADPSPASARRAASLTAIVATLPTGPNADRHARAFRTAYLGERAGGADAALAYSRAAHTAVRVVPLFGHSATALRLAAARLAEAIR